MKKKSSNETSLIISYQRMKKFDYGKKEQSTLTEILKILSKFFYTQKSTFKKKPLSRPERVETSSSPNFYLSMIKMERKFLKAINDRIHLSFFYTHLTHLSTNRNFSQKKVYLKRGVHKFLSLITGLKERDPKSWVNFFKSFFNPSIRKVSYQQR